MSGLVAEIIVSTICAHLFLGTNYKVANYCNRGAHNDLHHPKC
jgi:hypothetical protein